MKTQLKTENFTITLTEIDIDINDPTNYEITFETTITTEYFTSIHGIEIANEFCDGDNETYELNIAHRHENAIYCIVKHDRNGFTFDDIDSAISQFGTPIVDFIISHCKLLNIPLYPNL